MKVFWFCNFMITITFLELTIYNLDFLIVLVKNSINE